MPTQNVRTGVLIAAVTFAVCAAIFVPILLSRGHSPSSVSQSDAWEEENYPKVVRMKGDAEALALKGKIAEAHEQYRQIEQLVGSHKVRDPRFWDLLQQLKADQDRIYNLALRIMERDVAGPTPNDTAVVAPEMPATNPPAAIAQPTLEQPPSAQANNGASQSAASMPPAPVVATVPPASDPAMPAPDAEYPPAYSDFRNPPATQQTPAAPTTSPVNDPSTVANDRPIPTGEISDEAIGAALNRSVKFLLANFDGDQLKDINGIASPVDKYGLNALCVYALLQAGHATHDPRLSPKSETMIRMIERMKTHDLSTDVLQAPVVYARSLRSAALAVYNRPEDRAVLRNDVDWLLRIHWNGAYTYDDRFVRPAPKNDKQQGSAQPLLRNLWLDPAAESDPQILAHNGEPPGGNMPRTPIISRPPMGPRVYIPRTSRNAPIEQPTTVEPRPSIPVIEPPWDNSNSQYGLLGVWAGAETGLEIPVKYWQLVEKHWVDCQLPNGRWTYNATSVQPTAGMTAAGIASLLVTQDYLSAQPPPKRGSANNIRHDLLPSLVKGLAWLESGDNSVTLLSEGTIFVSYNLYGVERVGLASGFKYFGKHDWYPELAARVVGVQWPNGAFGRVDKDYDAVVETAFTTLFLARGRHPIVMNKLRFDGFWSNRPRDAANVARYLTKQFERPLNWQVVPLSHDWPDWMDAPILYIASDDAPVFGDEQIGKLRSYAQAGGLLFTHSDNNSAKFNTFVEKTLAPKLFREYEMKDVPPNDVVYKAQFALKPPLPKLRGIWNGSRWLLLHSAGDLGATWQTRNEKGNGKQTFDLVGNLFLYTAGKSELRNRLASPYIPEPQNTAMSRVKIARLQYAGNWDPEPYAWTRFARWLQFKTDTALDLVTIKLVDLKPGDAPLAVLTGTSAVAPADTEIAAMRAYVEAGGTILIDSCGGSPAFSVSMNNDWLPKLSPPAKLEAIPPTDAMLAGGNGLDDLAKLRYRPETAERVGADDLKLKFVRIGKGKIIYSPVDITSGLLGTYTQGIFGFDPASATGIAKNVVLQAQSASH